MRTVIGAAIAALGVARIRPPLSSKGKGIVEMKRSRLT
jgi:hypothetical protein